MPNKWYSFWFLVYTQKRSLKATVQMLNIGCWWTICEFTKYILCIVILIYQNLLTVILIKDLTRVTNYISTGKNHYAKHNFHICCVFLMASMAYAGEAGFSIAAAKNQATRGISGFITLPIVFLSFSVAWFKIGTVLIDLLSPIVSIVVWGE